MSGSLEAHAEALFLRCSVNGVKSRPKLVILDNSVHLFSPVGFSASCEQAGSGRLFQTNTPRGILKTCLLKPSPLSRVFAFVFAPSSQEGSAQVCVPVPRHLAASSGSSAQGGAVAPMTGTIEKVGLSFFIYFIVYSGQIRCKLKGWSYLIPQF